jgi:uncharacterized RDD family membrane protein YckC
MNEITERELSIVTPEQVKLQYETAGIGSRAGAHIMDWLVLGVIFTLLFTALAETTSLFAEGFKSFGQDYAVAFAILLFFGIQYAYFVLTEFYMGGKTFGKKWMGIRVIQENGQALTMLSSLIRNFLRVIDSLPLFYTIGIVVSFLHKKDKRIGDMLAGTVVVIDLIRDRKKQQKQMEKLLDSWNDFLPDFVVTDAQKSKMTREDWIMLSTFMERLPRLTKVKLSEISQRLATHLFQKLEIKGLELDFNKPTTFLIVLYKQTREDWEI